MDANRMDSAKRGSWSRPRSRALLANRRKRGYDSASWRLTVAGICGLSASTRFSNCAFFTMVLHAEPPDDPPNSFLDRSATGPSSLLAGPLEVGVSDE